MQEADLTPTPTMEDDMPYRAVSPRKHNEAASVAHAEFAKRLWNAMQARGMNASSLAAAVWGQHIQTVKGKSYTVSRNRDRLSMYLSGRGFPRHDTLKKISEALGVNPLALTTEVQSPGSHMVPPEVGYQLLHSDDPRKRMARLTVNTVVPTKLALQIVQMLDAAKDEQTDVA